MVYHDTAIRAVMERLNLDPLKRIAQQPGTQTALQVLIYDIDERAKHTINRLIHQLRDSLAELEAIYFNSLSEKHNKWLLDYESYRNFISALQVTNTFPFSLLRNTSFMSTLATTKRPVKRSPIPLIFISQHPCPRFYNKGQIIDE